jgi:hypothetical protein
MMGVAAGPCNLLQGGNSHLAKKFHSHVLKYTEGELYKRYKVFDAAFTSEHLFFDFRRL